MASRALNVRGIVRRAKAPRVAHRVSPSRASLDLDQLLTPPDVSTYLGVPLGTLANWRYLGRGPAYLRVGRHVRYRRSDVAAWTDSLAAEAEQRADRRVAW